MQRKSPLVQVNKSYGSLVMVSCRLSSGTIHQPIMLVRASGSIKNQNRLHWSNYIVT